MAYIFLLGHLIGLVGYTVATRKLMTGGVNKYQLALVFRLAFLCAASAAFIVGYFDYAQLSSKQIALLGLSGFTGSIFLILTNKTLQQVEASQFQILFSLRILLISLVGFLILDEQLPALRFIGGLLILIAILTLHIRKGTFKLGRSSWWGIALASWFTIHASLEKYNVDEVGVGMYLLWSGLFSSVILTSFYLLLGRKDSAPWRGFMSKPIAVATAFRVMSGWGYVLALASLPLTLNNYVSSTSVVILVGAGYLFLGERENVKQKLIAACIAFAGLSLVFLA